MAETAAFFVNELIPLVPVRQCVVPFPVQLRLWLALSKELLAAVCRKAVQCIERYLRRVADKKGGHCGMTVFVPYFGSGANLRVVFGTATETARFV